MRLEIEYYEWDCHEYCTPDGCKGHTSDIPVAIILNDVRFEAEGYDGGDYPSDPDTINKVTEVINKLLEILE